MAVFVVDASVALAWCFADESTPWTEGLLDRLFAGDRAMVPAHWPVEILNSLLMAVRKKRIDSAEATLFWDRLASLAVGVEPVINRAEAMSVLALGEKYKLTAYDAAYLDLARRKQLPLATLDNELRRAAPSEHVQLL